MTGPAGELLLFTGDNGAVRLHVRLVDEMVWLSQAMMAQLFGKDVRTISEHPGNIFDEGELDREATIRNFRIVRTEGSRQVSRDVEHYALPGVLAVGSRVRSPQGTRFQQWATERLDEIRVAEEFERFQAAHRAIEVREPISDLDRMVEASRRIENEGGDR